MEPNDPVARVLIVDDDPAVHDSYRMSFAPADDAAQLADLAAELFDDVTPGDTPPLAMTFDHVHQGNEAVAAVERAVRDDRRFAVAFIDVRMPPGIDGRETARRIRAIDPDVQIVIVTGYSDFSPAQIARVAGPPDRLFYIAKPFTAEEVVQTATALSHRWLADRELARTRAALATKIEELEDQARELAANESKAIRLANRDPLTGAPNRLAFLRNLSEQARRPGAFAMAMIDLDRFKLINDTLGHLVGDELIRTICAILIDRTGDHGFVARLGGDEFGVLLHVDTADAAVMRCERLVRACSADLQVFGHPIHGAASIGVVMVAGDTGRDPVDVMRRADLALNEAKRSGRGVVRLFDDSMDESIRFRRRVEEGLTQAIAKQELALLYQPIVAQGTLDIVGFEGLLRWNSPDHGAIGPATFVPIAEESNLIHDLGDWVLDSALAMLADWPSQYVSVNFSPRQFRRQNFVGHLVEKVQRAGIAPDRLQIEITETAIFDDAERAADTLYRLRQMGFRIALDDFGTGYSSLYNIRKFALDCLKIDRSFIDGMGRERESAAIVHSIIHLARALRLEVVAEGVETEQQVQALRLAGCSHLQGYFLSRPVDGAAATDMARSGAWPGQARISAEPGRA
ncbi:MULTISPECIES: GGDEF/EAL domain-containing response regulator [Sphingomonas]|jgi:diguanylate cyclase (GGDEF)-like protein|uniref:Diguanylate cyclase n=1 Tax=Sphingomonas hankookensis TaxID=563996 RepID=A0ABR5YF40_9SPHN|nr:MULTISPECIES: EAL domain-containing protein [Sphingomonas]KZE18000.1 diguanylate cyclase [Sphingomonas hankookensis]PZT93540.1 MAG: GGDEF domain-containing protein [Sphingomonas sp.]